MKFLLDTHLILWWLAKSSELSGEAYDLISNPSNLIFISAASIWEIRIKEALGKLALPKNFASVLQQETFEKLPITVEHAHAIQTLPFFHRDPFDRMLIAQAMLEHLLFVTRDQIVKKYDVEHILV